MSSEASLSCSLRTADDATSMVDGVGAAGTDRVSALSAPAWGSAQGAGVPQRDPESTRVLVVAARLLSRVPFDQVTLQDVADDAGTPLGELVRLYGSMHDLGATILDHEKAVMAAIQFRVQGSASQPLDQVVMALPEMTYTSGGLENPAIRREVCEILEGGQHAFEERARRLRIALASAR